MNRSALRLTKTGWSGACARRLALVLAGILAGTAGLAGMASAEEPLRGPAGELIFGPQCGDADESDFVDSGDVAAIRAALVDPNGAALSGGGESLCQVVLDGSGEPRFCGILDVVVLRRALADPSRGPGVATVCPALKRDPRDPVFPGLALLVATGTQELTIAWLPASDDTTPVADIVYEVHVALQAEFSPGPTTLRTTVTGGLQAVVGGLVADTTYDVLVIAVDGIGRRSPERDYQTAQTAAVPTLLSSVTPLERADQMDLGVPLVNGTTFTFTPGPGAVLPTVGAILVDPRPDSGYLRRVVSVTPSGAQLIVETADGSLADAVDQISIRGTVVFNELADVTAGLAGATAARARSSLGWSLQESTTAEGDRVTQLDWADGLLRSRQWEPGVAGVGARGTASGAARGRFDLGPLVLLADMRFGSLAVPFELGLDPSGTPRGHVFVKGDFGFELGAEYTLTATSKFEETLTIIKFTKHVVIEVPPAPPVLLTFTLSVDAKASGEATATLTAGATVIVKSPFRIGAELNPATGQWQALAETPGLNKPTLKTSLDLVGTATADLRLVPKLDVAVYKVLGASFSVEPFVKASAVGAPTSIPACPLELSKFDIVLGAECLFSASFRLLKKTIPIVKDAHACGPFEEKVFDLPQAEVSFGPGGSGFSTLSVAVTDGINNPLLDDSIEWEAAPGSGTVLPAGGSRQPDLVCPEPGSFLVTYSGHGALGPFARRCQQITVGCPVLASLRGIGDLPGGSFRSRAFDVSDNGAVIVGHSQGGTDNRDRPFRWTASTGIQPIPDLFSILIGGVSGDGRFVVGIRLSDDPFLDVEAARWSLRGGVEGLGDLPGRPPFSTESSRAYAVSRDGSVIVGTGQTEDHIEAFIWRAGQLTPLGFPMDAIGTAPLAISADGRVVLVLVTPAAGGPRYFRWTAQTGMVEFDELLPGGSFVQPAALSADGSVIVGTADSSIGTQAFRWTQEGGIQGLGFPAPFDGSAAGDVSGDGSIVLGTLFFGRSGSISIWDEVNGHRILFRVLDQELGVDLTGRRLINATAISADGRTIVGNSSTPDGPEGYVAVLGEPLGP